MFGYHHKRIGRWTNYLVQWLFDEWGHLLQLNVERFRREAPKHAHAFGVRLGYADPSRCRNILQVDGCFMYVCNPVTWPCIHRCPFPTYRVHSIGLLPPGPRPPKPTGRSAIRSTRRSSSITATTSKWGDPSRGCVRQRRSHPARDWAVASHASIVPQPLVRSPLLRHAHHAGATASSSRCARGRAASSRPCLGPWWGGSTTFPCGVLRECPATSTASGPRPSCRPGRGTPRQTTAGSPWGTRRTRAIASACSSPTTEQRL